MNYFNKVREKKALGRCWEFTFSLTGRGQEGEDLGLQPHTAWQGAGCPRDGAGSWISRVVGLRVAVMAEKQN